MQNKNMEEVANMSVPNATYTFSISPEFSTIAVIVHTKNKGYSENVVMQKFFTSEMRDKLKEKLVKQIRENDIFVNFIELSIDDSPVSEEQIFLIDKEDEENRKVKLYYRSETSDPDYYGDFNYLPNPLSHYSPSKMCKVTYDRGNSHGFGTAGITVETTLNFIKMMGWEDDLKYETGKDKYPYYEIKYNI